MTTKIPALIDYLRDQRKAEKLAASCETTPAYLWQIAYGHRKASTKLAQRIEQHSPIRRKTLRPDVYARVA